MISISREEAEQFRRRLKQLRCWSDLTRAALEERAGLPRGTVGHLENGNRLPTFSTLLKVVKVLGNSDYLLGLANVCRFGVEG